MADKFRFSTSQVFNYAKDSYLERTSRPIYAIVFLLPFIVLYELGTLLINTDVLNQTQVRVVAFVWLQHFLDYLGFGGKLVWAAPALMVLVILAALQLVSGKKWRVWFADFLPMAIECILLAIPLIVLSLFLHTAMMGRNVAAAFSDAATATLAAVQPTPASPHGSTLLADLVTGVGAGIYEELIFRLFLICLLMVLFQDLLGVGKRNSIILSVLISAAMFSAHHHIDFLNGRLNVTDTFDWTKFAFRTIAGVYFAILFAVRGFGITAGTHAFYDIIATLVNVLFFYR
jgi:hypothetical protein